MHRLDPAVAARLLALAAAAWPEECCGLLLGAMDGADGDGIAGLVPAANVAADRCRRFEIDPAVLIAAQRAARHGGAPVIGHYHSHPAGPAAPSAADRAEARGDGALWAIIAWRPGGGGRAPDGGDGGGQVRVWRDDPAGFALFSAPA